MKQISFAGASLCRRLENRRRHQGVPEINELGRRYAELPGGSPEKENLLLEICHCFHPYLMKYLAMICRGHVPIRGNTGDKIAPVNKDVKPFLLYFLPKGQSLNWRTMN